MTHPTGTTVPTNDTLEPPEVHPDDATTAELVIEDIIRIPPAEGEPPTVELGLYISGSFLREIAKAEGLDSVDDVSTEMSERYRDLCMREKRDGGIPPFEFEIATYPGITSPEAIGMLYAIAFENDPEALAAIVTGADYHAAEEEVSKKTEETTND